MSSLPVPQVTPESADPVLRPSRRRILIVAFTCSPLRGSEPGVGWNRAVEAARHFDTCVLTRREMCAEEIGRHVQEHGPIDGLHFEFVPKVWGTAWLERVPALRYVVYNLWQRRAAKVARRLHQEHPFDLVHQLTYCGFREPGYLWKLDVPFVWGPVGGAQNYPWRFLAAAGPWTAIAETVRTATNVLQLWLGRRVHRAASRAALMLTATTTNQQAIGRAHGVSPLTFPDAGVCEVAAQRPAQPRQDGPLRILWCGLLAPRKALHLLIEALAQTGQDVGWELRVVGDGSMRRRWEKLARTRGVDDRITWLGWVSHEEALEQFAWADVFAFTSLRDTMGTVLLEALAAGLPVVCLDHQGAADVIDETCGIKVPVTAPRNTVAGLADAVTELAGDSQCRERLSEGALRRARYYLWSQQGERLADLYHHVLDESQSGRHTPCSVRTLECAGVPPLSMPAPPTAPAEFRPEDRPERESDDKSSPSQGSPPRSVPAAAARRWDRLLRRYEALLGENSRKGVSALFDQAVVSGSRFLTTILIGRTCGASELGAYALAFSLMIFAVTTQDSLVLGPFTIYSNRLKGRRKAAYAGSVLVQSLVLMVLAVIALAAAAVACRLAWADASVAPVIGVLGAAIPLILLHQFGRRYAFADLDMRTAIALDVTAATFQIGGLIALTVAGALSAPAMFAVLGLASALPGLAWLWHSRRRLVIRPKQVAADLYQNWALGKWMLAGQMTAIAGTQVLAWLLALLMGTTATGIYAACVSVVCLANPILLGINNVLTPRTARAYAEGGPVQVRRVARKAMLALVGVTGALCVGLLLFGGLILRALYGADYSGHAHVIDVLALGTVMMAAGMAASRGLLALERPDLTFIAQLIGLGTTLVVSLVLIPPLGVAGAACGSLAGVSASAAVLITCHEVLTRPSRKEAARP